jgi:8-oxo-dGTP pyrophosphatase MutT (NUDIX family)
LEPHVRELLRIEATRTMIINSAVRASSTQESQLQNIWMNDISGSYNPDSCLDALRAKLAPADSIAAPKKGTERSCAAVLVPLFRRNGGLHVLYTRRSDRLVSHRGQVAFPGGRFDHRFDRDLLEAALREAQEEVGIEPDTVEVLGSFEGLRTHSTDIMVTPFVGVIPDLCTWTPDPREVADVFDVPLKVLSDSRYRGTYRWQRDGLLSEHPAIRYGAQVIWGLTYSLTLNFLRILETVRA